MNPLISFQEVTVIRNGRIALDGITLDIQKGENVAILGPNGCGKSTLVKAIARDLYPASDRGSIRIGGLDRWNLFELRKILGVVSNELQTMCSKEVTAIDLVISGFFGSYGVLEPYVVTGAMREQAHETLRFLNANHLSDRYTNELSSGECRRVLIARALVNKPPALLLDEPTTSLDIKSSDSLISSLRAIAQSGTNLLVVTHHIEEVIPEIDRVILLKNGKIFQDGSTANVLTSVNLSDLYESPVCVLFDGFRYHAHLLVT